MAALATPCNIFGSTPVFKNHLSKIILILIDYLYFLIINHNSQFCGYTHGYTPRKKCVAIFYVFFQIFNPYGDTGYSGYTPMTFFSCTFFKNFQNFSMITSYTTDLFVNNIFFNPN